GWMLRNYNPTIPDRFFFPTTQAIQRLQAEVGAERLLILGRDTLPPDTNLMYGLSLPTNYDALWLHAYDELWTRHFGGGDNNWRPASQATIAGLGMLGIRHVLTRGAWLPIETSLAGVAWDTNRQYETVPLLPGVEVVQTLTAAS